MTDRRSPRPAQLLAAVRALDGSTQTTGQAAITAWIREQYEARPGRAPTGLLARCALGHPYVDHTLDLTGDVLQHHCAADAPGGLYRRAGALIGNGVYAFVEVYPDGGIVAVRSDGSCVELGTAG